MHSFHLLLIPFLAGQASPAPARDTLVREAFAILKAHCAACHSSPGMAKGGFDFVLDRDRLVARRQVVPGKPDESPLWLRIQLGEMPPPGGKRDRVKPHELALLKSWIEAGAPGDEVARPPMLLRASDIVRQIMADLDRLDPRQRRFTRYLALTPQANAGGGPDPLNVQRQALRKLVNSLSWHSRLTFPEPIDVNRTIYRLDLRDYRWNARQWDRLAAASPFRLPVAATDRVLAERTGTATPWLRADWFVATASRPPFYHALLQLPATERALERLLQVDVADNLRDDNVVRAGFNGSGVAKNNRLLERHDALHGAYWRSYDFSENTGQQNIFERPLGPPPAANAFRHAGGESIFHLPNGLHGYFLMDADGQRVDKAPGDIVSDTKRPDRLVENGLSCFSCHAAGLVPKDDRVRAHVLKNASAFAAADRDTILAQYAPAARFRRLLDEDNQRYRRALAKIDVPIGEPEPIVTAALAYERVLDLQAAAAEAGLAAEDFAGRLRKNGELSRSLGPLLSPGGTVQRQVFEANYFEMARLLRLGESVPTPNAKFVPAPFAGHKGAVAALAFSQDGRWAASGGEDGVRVWDALTGREQSRYDGHRDAITALAFTPDGKQVFSASVDRSLHLWNATSGRDVRSFVGHTDAVRAVAISPDGRWAISGGQDSVIRKWDLASGKELATWTGHTGHVLCVGISPDGRLAASAGHDRSIRLWDVDSGRCKGTSARHTAAVRSLAFSPEGRWLLSGGEDRIARLWDVARGVEAKQFAGHANSILRVGFNANGQVLTASSQYRTPDRVFRAWEVATGEEIVGAAENLSAAVRVESVAFAPNGAWALASHGQGVLQRYRLSINPSERKAPVSARDPQPMRVQP